MFNPLFMEAAIQEAQKGLASSGIPIGSVLVHKNKIIGRGHNQRIQKKASRYTPKWMRLNRPADYLRIFTRRARYIPRYHLAPCARVLFFFIKFPV